MKELYVQKTQRASASLALTQLVEDLTLRVKVIENRMRAYEQSKKRMLARQIHALGKEPDDYCVAGPQVDLP